MTSKGSAETFGVVAAALADNGYLPLPVLGKVPFKTEWQHYRLNQEDTVKHAGANVGLLCGEIIGVDIDVYDEALAEEIDRLAEEIFGKAPRRVGRAPKRLLVYRTDAPFPKIQTAHYYLSGSTKASHVEILATGQQFVAFGTHPDTHQPYKWNGLGSVLDIPSGLLQSVTQEQAREFIAACEKRLAAVGTKKGGKGRNDSLSARAYRMRKEGASIEQIEAALLEINAKTPDPLEQDEVIGIAAGKRNVEPDSTVGELERDFYSYMPAHRYLHVHTRELWPAESVNGRLPWPMGGDLKPIKPSAWLDRNRPIEQLIWAPGEPELIQGRVVDQGGWIEHPGACVFNLYRAPAIVPGNAHAAVRWRDHLQGLYGEHTDHVERWLAFKIQYPGAKINHALVMGGAQGIGKDTLLEPIKCAVGSWNWSEINPAQMLGRFNGWAKGVVVRVSEARDLGDVDRYQFYEHSKVYMAAPPDVLRVDEKNLKEHSITNVCGVIVTTNHRTAGIYLPPDDRRHFVVWSDSTKEDFTPEYWSGIWKWYEAGGLADVATYLREMDLAGFDPKAPPPKTEAWESIVHCNISDDDSDLAGLIDLLGRPDVVTLEGLRASASGRQLSDVTEFLTDRRTKRQVPHALERAGYVPCINRNAGDGRWKVGARRETVYALATLSYRSAVELVKEKIKASYT